MTHKKIAKIANVSVSTVSKALSGSKEISEDLTEEIRRIALETGYFKKKNERKLGYINPKNIRVTIICPEIISIFYSSIVEMIRAEIESRGGKAIIRLYDFNSTNMNDIISEVIVKGDSDGIITFDEPEAVFDSIPVVLIGTSEKYSSAGIDAVPVDIIVNHLRELGHNKIGFVGETLTSGRENLFREALFKHGIEYVPDYCMIFSERFEKTGFLAAEKYIKMNDKPTAIIAAYDEIALGMIHELKKNGVRIPEDLSVASVNDIPYASYSQPPLTTIRIFSPERCAKAVDLLYAQIFEGNDNIQHTTTECELFIRESTAPPRKEDKNEL